MAGPTYPLQPLRDLPRRFDLADQLHGAHVDAQLEGAGGADGAHVAALQPLLGNLAHRSGDAAVVGQRDLLPRRLVQMSGEPLDLAPVVGEDNGTLPLPNHAQQPAGDPRPERLRLHVGQVIDRTEHLQRQPLAHPGVHDLHRARHQPVSLPRRSAQVAGHFLQRPLRG